MEALLGIFILSGTAFLFWVSLPRNGKLHRLIGTAWEPYFAILFVLGTGLGAGMIVRWAAGVWLS